LMRMAGKWLMPTIHGAIREAPRLEFRIVEFNVLG